MLEAVMFCKGLFYCVSVVAYSSGMTVMVATMGMKFYDEIKERKQK